MFGFRTAGTTQTILVWEKNLSREFRKPDFIRFEAKLLDGSMPLPQNQTRFSLWFGNDIDSTLYPAGNGGAIWFQFGNGNITWWIEDRVTAQIRYSTITRVVMKFTMLVPIPDGAEWVINNLRALYWPDTSLPPDSVVMMEPYGDKSNAASVTLIEGVPETFSLAQNYPNPFNPSTVIKFEVTSFKFVTLRVYNLIGQEVATLVNEELRPGSYEATWDARGMPSGTYIYRLSTNNSVETRKMVLLR